MQTSWRGLKWWIFVRRIRSFLLPVLSRSALWLRASVGLAAASLYASHAGGAVSFAFRDAT